MDKRSRKHGKTWEQEDAISKLYQEGLSTRQVAKRLHLSSSMVSIVVKKLGLSRGKSEAAVIACPPTSNHWRSARQAARRVWSRVHGEIPKGMHVHHKNRDYTDNRIENLEILTASEHARLHYPKNPVPRWKRPERVAYMKAYMETYRKKM